MRTLAQKVLSRRGMRMFLLPLALTVGACSATSNGDATPCTTFGEPTPNGGYGCDLTFAAGADANICLAPLHFTQSGAFPVRQSNGKELSIDAYEGGGSRRSVLVDIVAQSVPLSSGLKAGLSDPYNGVATAVFTMSNPPTIDGIVEFEATSGSVVFGQVTATEVTFTIDNATMAPFSLDPTNVRAHGTFTASLACHLTTD